ncbi:class I SAM-dependent methyltransferase [Acinetobacter sp. WZC-1]|uniref:class I SAM-dependent methyltransferase n=1 Tax=Acinetobacter sp. WZC-1 TaxID=3459034 RepID=UPI00403D7241
MTDSLHPAAQQGFSSAAELYQQARPDYPQQIVQWLKDELQIGPESVALELGAGTGKFLNYLKQATTHVTAVEPVTEMLQQLKMRHPDIQTLQTSSDQLPLASQTVDAVLCAQSFHWFANMETLKEIHRVLTPTGQLGLVWNQRDESIDWIKALADLLISLEGDTPRYHSDEWKQVFEHQSLFQLNSVKVFSQLHRGTVEHVVSQRLLSTSFIACMPPAQQQQLKQQFEQIVLHYTGKHPQDQIDLPYITYAWHFGKLDNQSSS